MGISGLCVGALLTGFRATVRSMGMRGWKVGSVREIFIFSLFDTSFGLDTVMSVLITI